MMIQLLFSDDLNQRFRYFAIVVSVVVSIVLHELAHGWAAIRLGDRTPIEQGRMTGNPLVHMGLISILAVFLMGLAWGAMPIDRTRVRGRHAEAIVAVAGPATNFVLAVLATIGALLAIRFGFNGAEEDWKRNLVTLLEVAAWSNIALMLFNLLPVPPLDGSHILASFHRGLRRVHQQPRQQRCDDADVLRGVLLGKPGDRAGSGLDLCPNNRVTFARAFVVTGLPDTSMRPPI